MTIPPFCHPLRAARRGSSNPPALRRHSVTENALSLKSKHLLQEVLRTLTQ